MQDLSKGSSAASSSNSSEADEIVHFIQAEAEIIFQNEAEIIKKGQFFGKDKEPVCFDDRVIYFGEYLGARSLITVFLASLFKEKLTEKQKLPVENVEKMYKELLQAEKFPSNFFRVDEVSKVGFTVLIYYIFFI